MVEVVVMLMIKVAAATMLVTGNYIGHKMMVLAAMESGSTLLGGGVSGML